MCFVLTIFPITRKILKIIKYQVDFNQEQFCIKIMDKTQKKKSNLQNDIKKKIFHVNGL